MLKTHFYLKSSTMDSQFRATLNLHTEWNALYLFFIVIAATFCFSLFYYYYLFFLFDGDRWGTEPWKFVEDLTIEIKLILLTKLVQSLSNLFFWFYIMHSDAPRLCKALLHRVVFHFLSYTLFFPIIKRVFHIHCLIMACR